MLAAAIMLLAAPAAFADTIKGAATVQFSGIVDSAPQCTTATGITINWGDSSTSSGSYDTNHAVTGSHTYANPGTYTGTIAFTGGTCTATTDSLTANVGPAPQFKQCPPVGVDFGCQFLIIVSSGSSTILQDTNQGPYESSEDALIGIQNNSSGPISSFPLSTPGSGLFAFEGDGLCNPGSGPIPSGCTPPAGAPAGATCSTVSNCSFPAPPGQPPGYVEPGAVSGNTQNGYEGPTTWFSNVSSNSTSGQVNLSPPLQPGQTTYFSLEEPPSLQGLKLGSKPTGVGAFPPTVTATGGKFTGLVNPNGSPTTANFEYGLDAKYRKPGASGPVYDHTTPAQSVGGDLSDHFITAVVAKLVPNALYHFRLVAKNADGTTFGADQRFTTKLLPAPATPTIGKNFNVSLVSGLVLIKVNGQFIPLTQIRQFPLGTVVNALNGKLKLTSATGKKRQTQSGTFFSGIFRLGQTRSGKDKGLTILTLVENAFKGAPTYNSCPKKASDQPLAGPARVSSKVLQTLRGNARGKFRTVGRFAAATIRGTDWGTRDRCDGTLTVVRKGTVTVSDFVRRVTVTVTGGHQYLAKR